MLTEKEIKCLWSQHRKEGGGNVTFHTGVCADQWNTVFGQAIFTASLVEFIEGLETMLRPQDAYDSGFRNGQKETVDKLKTFIKENQ